VTTAAIIGTKTQIRVYEQFSRLVGSGRRSQYTGVRCKRPFTTLTTTDRGERGIAARFLRRLRPRFRKLALTCRSPRCGIFLPFFNEIAIWYCRAKPIYPRDCAWRLDNWSRHHVLCPATPPAFFALRLCARERARLAEFMPELQSGRPSFAISIKDFAAFLRTWHTAGHRVNLVVSAYNRPVVATIRHRGVAHPYTTR